MLIEYFTMVHVNDKRETRVAPFSAVRVLYCDNVLFISRKLRSLFMSRREQTVRSEKN